MMSTLIRPASLALMVSLALLPRIAPSAQQPVEHAIGTGVISGVVVDAATGEAIQGAVVSIQMPGRRPVGQQGRQMTDRRGRFVFVEVPASAEIVIAASHPGYLFEDPGPPFPQSMPKLLAISEGEWVGNVRLEMSRLGSIGGEVLDELGEPVADVLVRLLSVLSVAGRERLAAGPITRTDDRGRYRMTNLLPGHYLVVVPSVQATVPARTNSARIAGRAIDLGDAARLVLGPYPVPPPPVDGQMRAYPMVFHPAGVSVAEAARIDLGPGRHHGRIDVRLVPLPAVQVSGRVEGRSESVNGLSLRLLASGLEELGLGSETATALVAPDGSFRFANVPAGAYTVEAPRAIGELQYGIQADLARPFGPPPGMPASSQYGDGVVFGPPGTTYSETSPGGARLDTGRIRITVGNRDLSGVVLPLTRPARLSGRVQFEFAPNTERPAQLPMVELRAEPADGSPQGGLPRTSTDRQDPARSFVFQDLVPGIAYLLRVSPGLGWQVKSITYAGRDHTYAPFDTSAASAFDDVVVILTNVPTLVAGSVRDRQGAPAGNARVVAFPAERSQWSHYGMTPPRLRSTLTSNLGAYQFHGLPAGDYYLVAVPHSLHVDWRGPQFFEPALAAARKASVRWGATTMQDLTITEAIR